jgi:hypothetical protein
VLVVLVMPAVLMIGAKLLERWERQVFMSPHPRARRVSTSDVDADC